MTKGKSAQVSRRVCLLYEPSTGTVKFIHHSIAMPGAQLPSEAAVEERAFKLAGRLRGLTADKLRPLHVDPAELKPFSHYRVDVASKKVVSEPLKRRPA